MALIVNNYISNNFFLIKKEKVRKIITVENIDEIQNVTEKIPFDGLMLRSSDVIPAFDELEFIKSYFFETLRESSLNPKVFIEAFEKFKK